MFSQTGSGNYSRLSILSRHRPVIVRVSIRDYVSTSLSEVYTNPRHVSQSSTAAATDWPSVGQPTYAMTKPRWLTSGVGEVSGPDETLTVELNSLARRSPDDLRRVSRLSTIWSTRRRQLICTSDAAARHLHAAAQFDVPMICRCPVGE